jgi:hypothetical protein
MKINVIDTGVDCLLLNVEGIEEGFVEVHFDNNQFNGTILVVADDVDDNYKLKEGDKKFEEIKKYAIECYNKEMN